MLFDTDVLIWYLRGNVQAAELLDQTTTRQTSVISYMELLVLCHAQILELIGRKGSSGKEPAAKAGSRGPIEPMRRRRWGVCGQPCGAGARRPWALALVVNVCSHTQSSSLRAHNPLALRQS